VSAGLCAAATPIDDVAMDQPAAPGQSGRARVDIFAVLGFVVLVTTVIVAVITAT
jgi:hypothetical protein